MSLFADLFSSVLPGSGSQKKDVVYLQGGGTYEMDIAGEEGYQAELEELCGPGQPDGVRQLEVAQLVLDPKRGYSANKNAIRVEIRGKQVGYLSVQATILYRRYLAAKGLPNARGNARLSSGAGGSLPMEARVHIMCRWICRISLSDRAIAR